jgi:hypothetical protein
MSVPTRTPIKQYRRFMGRVATLKPNRRSRKISMASLPFLS